MVTTSGQESARIMAEGKIPVLEAVHALNGIGAWAGADEVLWQKYDIAPGTLDYFSPYEIEEGPFKSLIPAEVYAQVFEDDEDFQNKLRIWTQFTKLINDPDMITQVDGKDVVLNEKANSGHFFVPDIRILFR